MLTARNVHRVSVKTDARGLSIEETRDKMQAGVMKGWASSSFGVSSDRKSGTKLGASKQQVEGQGTRKIGRPSNRASTFPDSIFDDDRSSQRQQGGLVLCAADSVYHIYCCSFFFLHHIVCCFHYVISFRSARLD